jgi:hypothetical protein
MDDTTPCDCLNCQLKARWREYYERSDRVIREQPDAYRQILLLLDEVCENILDIEAYFETASRISGLLKTMGPGTVFYNYFYEHIDPAKCGDARYFRMICRDLREQVRALNQWRRDQRRLHLVPRRRPTEGASRV